MRCRLCGCTESRACPGGCRWIAEGVCSSHLEEVVVELVDDLLFEALVVAVNRGLRKPPPLEDMRVRFGDDRVDELLASMRGGAGAR